MPEHQLADTKLFPSWLHVLMRVEDVGLKDVWSGRLHAIKGQIERMEISIAHSEAQVIGKAIAHQTTQHEQIMEVVRGMVGTLNSVQEQQQHLVERFDALEADRIRDARDVRIVTPVVPPDIHMYHV